LGLRRKNYFLCTKHNSKGWRMLPAPPPPSSSKRSLSKWMEKSRSEEEEEEGDAHDKSVYSSKKEICFFGVRSSEKGRCLLVSSTHSLHLEPHMFFLLFLKSSLFS
jgi:hypothetical protein